MIVQVVACWTGLAAVFRVCAAGDADTSLRGACWHPRLPVSGESVAVMFGVPVPATVMHNDRAVYFFQRVQELVKACDSAHAAPPAMLSSCATGADWVFSRSISLWRLSITWEASRLVRSLALVTSLRVQERT